MTIIWWSQLSTRASPSSSGADSGKMQASCKASETLEVKDGKFLVHFSHSSSHAHSQSRSILERFTASYSFMLCCLSQPQQLPKWASVHFIAWPEKKGCVLDYRAAGLFKSSKCSGRIREDRFGLETERGWTGHHPSTKHIFPNEQPRHCLL